MDFVDYIQHPKERMGAEVKNIDMNWAYKRFAIYGAIVGLVLGVGVALLGGIIGAVLGSAAQSNMIFGIIAGLGMLAVIIMPIVMAIFMVVGSYIGYYILFFVAKLLGGTGTFEANYFLGAKLLVPLIIANIIVSLLGLIPIVGAIINVVWFFYSLYLFLVLISTANKLSIGKSIVVLLLPTIIVFVLIFVLALGAVTAAMGASAI